MQCSHFVFLAVVLTAYSVMSLSIDEIKAECKKENNFDGDVLKIDINDPEFPKAAKCTIACTFEKQGAFKDDGSIDREKEKETIEKTIKDEELKKKFLKATEECDVTAKGDKCETAYEFIKCRRNMVKPPKMNH